MYYRRYRAPSIWQEVERLQREMNRLLESFQPRRVQPAPSFPAMNLWVSDEGIVVTAEVPGIKPEDIDVSVVNDLLTISGERLPEQVGEEVRYHRRERGCGKFARSIQLPFAVDANKVEASFENGVITINLPRKEEEKPKKIKVVAK
ncbi:MAG: Hsp20/alpha crystallin family protein [Anaerolineales bacterium]|nr:Hsp20/alpha crystallin family protein [Anaerolineales bacterium]MDW8161820.1 Hsp20/alpha crystallin family protein [Anaerolineales bacterium]